MYIYLEFQLKNKTCLIVENKLWWIFQDGNYKEEAESVLPKVNFWRDDGDTPGRQNHKEAKH
jgi:hypothetical protein